MVRIDLRPDPTIEPGHQWLVVPDSTEGWSLFYLLDGRIVARQEGSELLIPHDHVVDQNIVDLINSLAHVRFQSPTLVQLTLQVAPAGNHTDEEDGGLEGA